MNPTEWYAGIDGEKIGPLSADELLSKRERGEIAPDTLVWREGMKGWIPFSQSGLHESLGGSPAGSFLSSGEEMARCAVSGEVRPVSEMLQYGDSWIAPEHKEAFLQGLREGKQPASLSWGGYLYQDPGRLAKATWWLVVSSTVMGAIVTAINLANTRMFPDNPFPTQNPGWFAVSSSFSCAYLILFLATTVWFCLWTYRVAANAFAFGASWVRVSPGWAVGWHFVPIAFFWMPYLAMADVSRASESPRDGETNPTPGIVKSWWTLWILMNVISFLSGLTAGIGQIFASEVFAIAYLPVSIAGAWAACQLIRVVTSAQQETASKERSI